MRKTKPLTGFSRFTDSELEQHAQTILQALTGNADFPDPSPSLATLSAAITNFQNVLAKAALGNHVDTNLKYQSRAALTELLRRLGLYVERTAGGDAAKILSSGFKPKKIPTQTGPLPKPVDFMVKPMGKGEVKLKCRRMKNVRTYQWEYKQGEANEWIRKPTTKASILLIGLESGKEYFFRVVPIGVSDVRKYSDTISSFVL
ncbi:MAG TPA: fibronectin type III domain-containing protein [Chitinophagaceae bacterium]|nr:fibronectin type III domain-containing protein [Chitinophagaceae bacterium]